MQLPSLNITRCRTLYYGLSVAVLFAIFGIVLIVRQLLLFLFGLLSVVLVLHELVIIYILNKIKMHCLRTSFWCELFYYTIFFHCSYVDPSRYRDNHRYWSWCNAKWGETGIVVIHWYFIWGHQVEFRKWRAYSKYRGRYSITFAILPVQ